MNALIDTGFLFAVLDEDDDWHDGACTEALLHEPAPLLPDMVLPELAYLVIHELGYQALIKFFRAIVQGELPIEKLSLPDLQRATRLLEQYADNRVDCVDCAIVAIAERLNIQRVLTVDHRHFRIFRPRHCPYFVILPSSKF